MVMCMQEWYCNDLYCRSYGHSGRNILLVNGAMADCSFYDDLASYLSDTYTVYTYDHPGYGRSDEEGKSLVEQAEDIQHLIHAIGSCSVVGHFCGAIPVLQYLMQDGSGMDHVLLYEPFLCDLSDDIRIERLKKDMPVLLKEERYEDAGMALLDVLSAEPDARAFGEAQREYFTKNSHAFYAHECMSMLEYGMDYGKLDGRKIFVGIGDCSAGMPCEEMAERFREAADCAMVWFKGAHDAPYEQYQAFGKAMKELSL